MIARGRPGAWPTMSAASRAVLREIVVHGALPRAELAARLGLSKPSLTRITRSLVDEDFLLEGGTELRSGLGRPSELLHLKADSRRFVGFKLTGDHLYAVVSDLGATVVDTHDEPLVDRSVPSVLNQISQVVAAFEKEWGPLTALGVALAGTIQGAGRSRIVRESAFLGWADVPLLRLLEDATGLPCSVDNDVQALTAAEHWFGAGAGLRTMAVITVGVGIGCGLVVNDELVEGAHGTPGNMSHIIVNPAGPYCDRGHRGCASSYLTSSAIAGALPRDAGGERTYEHALEQARAGRPSALQAFADAGFALGCIIGTVANLIDPAKVILSGDGLAVFEFADADVWRGIRQTYHEDLDQVDVDVQPFDFGEWARGGAVLAIRNAISP
ncbi:MULTISPECIES: ROK family transcriptional regulator [unclassified Microbacterium]|uniref:ROK family transcriptional regulator n=1 Tax=unclassified Microbacterium TaxID=2609290 RepID=UPI00217DD934|nr:MULTISPECIES: ROK family transcriptional regulator [unclassified Microbacterium]